MKCHDTISTLLSRYQIVQIIVVLLSGPKNLCLKCYWCLEIHSNFKMAIFELLPDEVLLVIFAYLDSLSLSYCGQVSKRFKEVSQDKILWQKLKKQRETRPMPISDLSAVEFFSGPICWKRQWIWIKSHFFKSMSNLKYWPTDSGKVRRDVIEEKLEPLPNLIIIDHSWSWMNQRIKKLQCIDTGIPFMWNKM